MRWTGVVRAAAATVGATLLAASVGLAAPGAAVANGGQSGAGAVDWQPCPQAAAAAFHAQCGSVAVPVDWRVPGGPQVRVALLKVPATGPSRGAVLVDSEEVNGYGGSQIAFFLQHGTTYLGVLPHTHRTHDIVVFDPRGLGRSTTVTCPVAAHARDIPAQPASIADVGRVVAHNDAVFAGCLQGTGPLALHTDAVSQARDLEAIRRAVDADRLDWLGQAYGGEVGAVYAARYPRHAGRMVLDTAVDPYRPPAVRAVDAAHAEEAAFGAFAQWCAANPARCALAGTDPRQVLVQVADRGVAGLTGQEVREAVGQFLVGYPAAWPALAQVLRAALNGDGSGLQPFVAMTFGDPDHTASRTQVCADNRVAPMLLPAVAAQLRTSAPATAGLSFQWDALLTCAGWPTTDAPTRASLPDRVALATRPLVTATTGDPINPPVWGRDLADHLGADFLLASAPGHGALDNSPCAATAIDAYLSTGLQPSGTC